MVKPLLQAGAKPNGKALLEAAFWGRTDTMKLLLAATPDDGKALVAEVGDQALQATTHVLLAIGGAAFKRAHLQARQFPLKA